MRGGLWFEGFLRFLALRETRKRYLLVSMPHARREVHGESTDRWAHFARVGKYREWAASPTVRLGTDTAAAKVSTN
jgi:hypothetical protein